MNLLPENRGHNECIVGEAIREFRKEVVLANLGTWDISLSDDEFAVLETALAKIPMHGHRGFVEQQGSNMTNWNRK